MCRDLRPLRADAERSYAGRVIAPSFALVERPAPEEYQPRLRWWSHAWRLVVVLLISALAWVGTTGVLDHGPDHDVDQARWLLVDVALGLPAVALVFLRRRLPLQVALVTTVLATFSAFAAGPATLASVSLATRRRWPQVVLLGVAGVASGSIFTLLRPAVDPEPWWVTALTNVVFTSAMLAWGMYIGSRRELLWTLRSRAERAEAEQELRVAQSQQAERDRIAREMHDVLAHRISQISMRAGALSYRDDLTAEQMRADAHVIRDTAHEALTDLRGVLGVLRDPGGGVLDTPQPTYDDLDVLVDRARAAGQRIEFSTQVETIGPVPPASGRTLYRIVQEGITNARKHAPGSQLWIRLEGSPDDGLAVTLRNPIGFGPSTTPGSGLGLVGLAERAELRGGRLEHRREGDEFVLRGWIPWAA